MSNPFRTDYDGMILGISHAEVGVLPQLLHSNFCKELYPDTINCKSVEKMVPGHRIASKFPTSYPPLCRHPFQALESRISDLSETFPPERWRAAVTG